MSLSLSSPSSIEASGRVTGVRTCRRHIHGLPIGDAPRGRDVIIPELSKPFPPRFNARRHARCELFPLDLRPVPPLALRSRHLNLLGRPVSPSAFVTKTVTKPGYRRG